MWRIQAVHGVAPSQVDSTEVLKQTTQRAIVRELNTAREGATNSVGCAEELRCGDDDDAKRDDYDDAKPISCVRPEMTLFGKGHDEAGVSVVSCRQTRSARRAR